MSFGLRSKLLAGFLITIREDFNKYTLEAPQDDLAFAPDLHREPFRLLDMVKVNAEGQNVGMKTFGCLW